MKDYLSWMGESGFWSREIWDDEKKRMVGAGYLKLLPEQRRILSVAMTPNEEGILPYTTVLFSTTKKSGKTTIGASVAAWGAEEMEPGTEVYVIANDLDQAEGRVMRDVKFHVEHWNLGKPPSRRAKITQYRIEYPNGTFIQALAQAYRSAAGSRHSITVWDELWGVTSELSHRMWDEMTPIPTVPNSLRFIATYAGFENESDLLWQLYLSGVGLDEHEKGLGQPIEALKDLPCWANGRQFTYWNHEPIMPWQTEEYIDEQMTSLRPSAFLRLHMNRWVTTHEEFIPVEWWDAAAKIYEASAALWSEHPLREFPIYIGVDAGVKRDCTAVVAVAYDATRAKLGLVEHHIWKPKQGEWFDLDATVEQALMDMNRRYRIASVGYDPSQLHQTMVRMRNRGLPVHEFFQTVPAMTSASQLLYDLLKNRNLEAYPDEEARKHIQMAVAETNNRGFRIVKSSTKKTMQPVDFAIALAMAAYDAVDGGGVDVSIPLRLVAPFADMLPSDYSENMGIPFPLRT